MSGRGWPLALVPSGEPCNCKVLQQEARRVVAWDDKVLEMQAKKLRSKNGLLWGEPEVLVWLKWKCTGVPTAVKKKHDQV